MADIDADVRRWCEEAISLCERATQKGVKVVFRNDDEEILVTNAKDAGEIRELGMALATGYSNLEEND